MTSFKLAIPHRFRKSPPVQISSAHTALLQQQAGSPPDNIWHGADRQHDWCLPTTQDVPGISTSAEKAVPLLSYHIRHYADGCLARQMFIRQH